MFIDSHCHLHFFSTRSLSEAIVIEEACKCGVDHMLCVATHIEQHDTLQELCAKYSRISISIGLHPNEYIEKEPDLNVFFNLLNNKKIVAIGETGLDYYHLNNNIECQKQRFRTQIQVAKICKKPLIIHTRNAAKDTIQVLKEEHAFEIGGVIHCFTEDWGFAQIVLDMGFYISFSGIVTFNKAKSIQDVAKKVPIDRILIETDSPYLAPDPVRGVINQPAYIKYIAEFIAKLRNMELKKLAQATTKNYNKLFNGN